MHFVLTQFFRLFLYTAKYASEIVYIIMSNITEYIYYFHRCIHFLRHQEISKNILSSFYLQSVETIFLPAYILFSVFEYYSDILHILALLRVTTLLECIIFTMGTSIIQSWKICSQTFPKPVTITI